MQQSGTRDHARDQDPASSRGLGRSDIPEDGDKPRVRKRLRVSQACDQCRKRKDRCDGQHPTCWPCSIKKVPCTYEPSTKKRGLPTGYVKSIEVLLGLALNCVDGSEAFLLAMLRGEEVGWDKRAPAAITGRDPTAAEALLDIWRKSSVLKHLEQLLNLAESAEDENLMIQFSNDNSFTPPVPLGANWLCYRVNPGVERPETFRRDHAIPNSTGPMSRTISRSLPSEAIQPPNLPPPSGIARSRLPRNWEQLLDLYFSNTHSWFPIAQKQDLLRPAYVLAGEHSHDSTDPLAPGERAFLWAALAYTSHQCDVAGIKPEGPETAAASDVPTQELMSTANSLVSNSFELSSYELGHVRALLLLALLHIGKGSFTKAWLLVGRSVYVAIDLGILPGTGQNLSRKSTASVEDAPRRALLGCFVLETLTAARLGRRPYLKRSDLQYIGLLHADGGIEEWESLRAVPSDRGSVNLSFLHKVPARALSIFNQFVELMMVLNDFMCHEEDGMSEMNRFAIYSDFKNWRANLPPHCNISLDGGTVVKAQGPVQALNLNLASAAVYEILRANAIYASNASARPQFVEPIAQVSQLETLIANVQSTEYIWNPPVFEVYLSLCEQSMTLVNQHNPDLVTNRVNVLKKIILEMKNTWCGTKKSSNNPMYQNLPVATESSEALSNHSLTATSSSNRTNTGSMQHHLSPQNTFPMSSSSNAQMHLQTHTSPRVSGSQSNLSQHQQTNDLTTATNFPHNMEFANFPDSLSGADEDALFNDLALLEPVDP